MSIPLRVRHLLSSQSLKLSEFILSHIEMPAEYFFELLDLGAVYLNQKRCIEDQTLAPGDYVRIHTSPKRFPFPKLDLDQTVVAWEEDFVVFNKPQGYPCHSLVDNRKDNLISYYQNHFGRKFFLTHRLDIGTGGLWLLALNSTFQREFNLTLQQQKLEKKYFAKIEGLWGDSPRIYTHFMKPSDRAPRFVFSDWEDGYQECRLRVEDVHATSPEASELALHLLTGRTHQIRSQMAFLGHPVWGDTMYGSTRNYKENGLEKWALWAQSLKFESRGKTYDFKLSKDQLAAALSQFTI